VFRVSVEEVKYNTLIPRAAVESLNQKIDRHTGGSSAALVHREGAQALDRGFE